MSQMIQRKQTKRFLSRGRFILLVLLLALSLWPQPKIAQAQWTDNGSNLTTSDNVGIGTPNPTAKLDVVGLNNGSSVRFTANTSADVAGAVFTVPGVTNWSLGNRPSGAFVLNNGNIFAGTDLITVLPGGKVGIGTPAPGTKLDIIDSGNTTLDVITARRGVDNEGEYTGIQFGSTITNFSGALRYILGAAGAARVGLYVGDNAGNVLAEKMTILSNGNVGIGTTTPRGTLDVNGRNSYIGTIPVALGHASSGYPGIGYNFEAQADGNWKYKFTDTAYMIGLGQSHRIDFNYAPLGTGGNLITWNTAMSIKNDGNIGIGTTTPTNKLDVKGSVGIGGSVNHGNGLTITSINPSAANHITTFQGPASGTNDVFWFDLNRAGGAYGSFDISGNGATFVHFPMASLTAPGYINTPGNFYFNSGGSIGIGTSTPDSTKKLHVAGDVRIDGNIAAKYQDVAEWVTSPKAMPAGTVVILHPDQTNQVLPSMKAYDTRVAGVISEMPGLLLGEAGEDKVKVATTGRVKVKVDATKGPVKVGDLLVTSDKEGIAMKSEPLDLGGVPIHRPGTLIGKALEPLKEGEGEILVLLSLQ